MEFKTAWLAANPDLLSSNEASAGNIDKVLHAERALHGGGKATFQASLAGLPVGAFFEEDGLLLAVGRHGLLRWSFGGYSQVSTPVTQRAVKVLTPRSLLNMYAAGFSPTFDPTADR